MSLGYRAIDEMSVRERPQAPTEARLQGVDHVQFLIEDVIETDPLNTQIPEEPQKYLDLKSILVTCAGGL